MVRAVTAFRAARRIWMISKSREALRIFLILVLRVS